MQVTMSKDARTEIIKGINTLADAVEATMGPKGRNVIIKRKGMPVKSTKDGVTVAKEVILDDELQNAGAEMVREVADRANSLAGDGTTTATVLARALIVEGIKCIELGANPIDLKRDMDKAVEEVVASLGSQSNPMAIGSEQLKRVASISANNDDFLGGLIAEAFNKVGALGVVTVEESRNHETYIDVVEGMQFDRGYISPLFATTPDGKTCQLENPMFLLCDRKITNMGDVIPSMELAKAAGRPLVVIAEDVDAQALGQLSVNVMHQALRSVAIKAPGFNESRYDILTDIATITKSVVFSSKTGFTLDNVTEEMFGGSEGITVEKGSTVIVNGNGNTSDVKSRVLSLVAKIEKADSEHEKKQLNNRVAKMSSGVGVVYVGANSPVEAKEKKDRADDALCATRAAIEEGIVEGGGIALLRASKKITGSSMGSNIVRKALLAPITAIIKNSGESPEVILSNLRRHSSTGYNASTGQLADMIVEGIVDPKKVTRVALENANSVAGIVLLTECAIIE